MGREDLKATTGPRAHVFSAPETFAVALTVLVTSVAAAYGWFEKRIGGLDFQGPNAKFSATTWSMTFAFQLIIILLVFGWVRWIDKTRSVRELCGRSSWRATLVGVVGAAVVFAVYILGWNLAARHGSVEVAARSGVDVVRAGSFILVIEPLNAIKEELVFRGYVLTKLRSRGAVYAVIASSVLFSLWHFGVEAPSVMGFVLRAALGLYLGCIFLWTRSLAASAVAHALGNVGTRIFSGNPHSGGLFVLRAPEHPLDFAAWIAAMIVAATVAFFLTRALRADLADVRADGPTRR